MSNLINILGWLLLCGGFGLYCYRNILNLLWLIDNKITASAFWVWLIFTTVFCGILIGGGVFLIKVTNGGK